MNTEQKKFARAIVPMMLAFFAMGFVDMVGTATNYVNGEFPEGDVSCISDHLY